VKAEDGNAAKRIRSRCAKDATSNRNTTVAISRDESSAARSRGREGATRKEMGLLVRDGSLGSIIKMGAKTVVVMMEQSIDRVFVEFPVKVAVMAWNIGHAGDVNIDGVDAKDIVGFEQVEEAVIISGKSWTRVDGLIINSFDDGRWRNVRVGRLGRAKRRRKPKRGIVDGKNRADDGRRR
jgi:hypothetical protein